MLHAASKPRFTAPEILELVKIAAGSEHRAGRIDHGDPLVQVNPHALPELFLTLRDHSELKLEQLIDVTAVHSESLKSFPVQVKASTTGALVQSSIDKWCDHSIDEDNRQTIGPLKPLKHPNLVWVLVRLGDSGISGCGAGSVSDFIIISSWASTLMDLKRCVS